MVGIVSQVDLRRTTPVCGGDGTGAGGEASFACGNSERNVSCEKRRCVGSSAVRRGFSHGGIYESGDSGGTRGGGEARGDC